MTLSCLKDLREKIVRSKEIKTTSEHPQSSDFKIVSIMGHKGRSKEGKQPQGTAVNDMYSDYHLHV